MKTEREIKNIIELGVSYPLSGDFVSKVKEQGCEIEKVVELISGKVLIYLIDCPKEKEDIITDYAFMTFIKNPVFQKYYHDSQSFIEIANKFIGDKRLKEAECILKKINNYYDSTEGTELLSDIDLIARKHFEKYSPNLIN